MKASSPYRRLYAYRSEGNTRTHTYAPTCTPTRTHQLTNSHPPAHGRTLASHSPLRTTLSEVGKVSYIASRRDQYWSEHRPYRFGFAARRDSCGADTDRIGAPSCRAALPPMEDRLSSLYIYNAHPAPYGSSIGRWMRICST